MATETNASLPEESTGSSSIKSSGNKTDPRSHDPQPSGISIHNELYPK